MSLASQVALFAQAVGAQVRTLNKRTADPTLYNFKPTNLTRWRAAMARVRAGTGIAKLACIGDSTTAGAGAGTGGTEYLTAAYANGYPTSLAALLTKGGLTAYNNSWFGDQSVTASSTYPAYDTRMTLGASWTWSGLNAPGGQMIQWGGTTSSTLAFKPTASFTTITIYYVRNSGANGSFATNVDGGTSLGTTNTGATGTLAVVSATFTVTAGTHTINIVPTANSGAIYICGIVTSTVGQVVVEQFGMYGATVAAWADSSESWSPLNVQSIYAPDLSVICLTINDSNASTDITTYKTQMQQLITQALVSGDVILMTGVPSGTTQGTDGTLATFVAANYALADTNNVPLIDLTARWQSYAVSNALGLYYDTLHPNAVGYQDVAQAAAVRLLAT